MPSARSHAHSRVRGRGLRGRRRDRHARLPRLGGGLRRIYGHPGQGLRPAGGAAPPHLQTEGRRHRDRRRRGRMRQVRHRRSRSGARHSGVVGRRVGQHPGRPGHRREGGVQAGGRVGRGGEHPRQRRQDKGQAGREDRRVGRPPATGQGSDHHPHRRARGVLARRSGDLPAQHRRAEGALCRTRFHLVPARRLQYGSRRGVGRAPTGSAAAVGRDGPRQVGGGQAERAGGSGRSLRRARGDSAERRGARGREPSDTPRNG